jgi:hypothetical protein
LSPFRRFIGAVTVALAIGTAIGVPVVANNGGGGGGGGGPTGANLWIDTTGGTCTRQSTAGAWVDAQGCGSMQAALTAAQGGDAIIMKDGTYGAQTLATGEKASMVTITAEDYRQVFVGQLESDVGNVTVSGVTGAGSGASLSDLRLVVRTGKTFILDGFKGGSVWLDSNNIVIERGDFCNGGISTSGESDCMQWWNGVTNITLKNSILHDWTTANDTTNHNDFIQVFPSGSNLDIDGNIFDNGPTSIIQMGGGAFSNVTFENNYFGLVNHCGNLASDSSTTRSGFLRFRNNVYGSLCGTYGFNDGSTTGTYTIDISGNIYLTTATTCSQHQAVSGGFNVFPTSASATCGTNPKKCTPTFLNGTPSAANGFDIRLSPSDTCAKDAGNASSFAPVDFFGTARPLGIAPDAGADEVG